MPARAARGGPALTRLRCGAQKPAELMTPLERAEASTPWRENKAADGRVYYYNKDSKETCWTIPDELRLAREGAERAQKALSGAVPVPVPAPPPPHAMPVPMPPPQRPPVMPIVAPAPVVHIRAEAPRPAPAPAAPAPTYASEADAKEAFKALLLEAGVRSDDSWEKAMKAIIHDPRYGALPSLGRKKGAFAEYTAQRAKAEKEERRQRERAAREALRLSLDEAVAAGRLDAESRPRDAEHALAGDARCTAALAGMEARERESLLADVLAELAAGTS